MSAAWVKSPANRQRLYLLLTALLPILATYGVIADSDVSLWLTLAGALLGAGGTALAAANTRAPYGKHAKR